MKKPEIMEESKERRVVKKVPSDEDVPNPDNIGLLSNKPIAVNDIELQGVVVDKQDSLADFDKIDPIADENAINNIQQDNINAPSQ